MLTLSCFSPIKRLGDPAEYKETAVSRVAARVAALREQLREQVGDKGTAWPSSTRLSGLKQSKWELSPA